MSATKSGEFTGRHMLLLICGFFAVVIGVNVLMAVSASRTWTGLVVQNSYVESQRFQEKHEQARAQMDAGWHFGIGYDGGKVTFSAKDDAGAVLALEGVGAFLRRPVGGHDDLTLELLRNGDTYSAPTFLASGVWDVTVTIDETALGRIEFERRISVP